VYVFVSCTVLYNMSVVCVMYLMYNMSVVCVMYCTVYYVSCVCHVLYCIICQLCVCVFAFHVLYCIICQLYVSCAVLYNMSVVCVCVMCCTV
jgi:hypothetical protein